MKNNSKQTVVGSTGKKYIVSKTKKGELQCSCPRWVNTTPRKNCKHIESVLTGKPVAKETKAEHRSAKRLVVKAEVKHPSLNVKQASEKIYRLIASTPGKLGRRLLVKKSQLDQSTVSGAVDLLWAAKRISQNRNKKGWLSGGYIPRKAESSK